MSETKCFIPNCNEPAQGIFREAPLCNEHLKITQTWEWFFGGPVRLPTLAELKQARGTKEFAEYALSYFLRMNMKYGAIDFRSGAMCDQCRRYMHRLILERKLRIWTFRRGANAYRIHGDATLYLVRQDLEV